MRKIVIVSLRFAPAFGSHLVAYRKAFAEMGLDVEFILDPQYRMFADVVDSAPTSYFGEGNGYQPKSHDYALFCNISTSNRRLAVSLKQRGTKIAYIYHEPWSKLADYLANESIKYSLKLIAAHRCSISMLKVADSVILPSQYAMEVYRGNDMRYNANAHVVPLLFDDEVATATEGQRTYFSYIGGIERSHGFDQYIDFVRWALGEKLDMRFMIASRSALPARLFKERMFQDNMDRIAIRAGRPLSNVEINECYGQSVCVWNVYRRSTQSGVLPNAFMCGTPVLASRVGAFPEFVEDGITGKFVEGWNHEEIALAFRDIEGNSEYYSENCRTRFHQVFYFGSNIEKLKLIV